MKKVDFRWTFQKTVVLCCAKGGIGMDTIKELFYGNVHPFERDIKKDSEHNLALPYIRA